jgi:hypothetical protein
MYLVAFTADDVSEAIKTGEYKIYQTLASAIERANTKSATFGDSFSVYKIEPVFTTKPQQAAVEVAQRAGA